MDLSLVKIRTVNLSKLANAFDNDAKFDANYKRTQRFFRCYDVNLDAFSLLINAWYGQNQSCMIDKLSLIRVNLN